MKQNCRRKHLLICNNKNHSSITHKNMYVEILNEIKFNFDSRRSDVLYSSFFVADISKIGEKKVHEILHERKF